MSFCNNCGNQLGDGERFCGKCGAPVGTPQHNQQNNQQQPQQQYQQQSYQQQQYQQQYQQQSYQQQGQMYQPTRNQGVFVDSAKTYGKKAYGATDTFLSKQFGVGLGNKKMLYMIILLGIMLFVLIFMITKSYATHLRFDSSLLDYMDRSEIREWKAEAEREAKEYLEGELGLLFGAAKVVDIIFNFLPMLAATLVACIPFFNTNHIWKRGYLLFLRIFLFYNAGSLLLTQLIYMVFNSTIGSQSILGVKFSYTISLSTTAVLRLLLEIAAIVLTFLIRSELLKEQSRSMMNTYNAYPGGQEYANSAVPQGQNNDNTGMYQ